VHQISSEQLDGFASHSQGRYVWSLDWTDLNVKVKGQGHQGQKMCCALPSPAAAYEWYALAANNVKQQQTGPFCRCWGRFQRPMCSLF